MAVSLLVSAWLVGALGGLHCASMCGGFIAVLSARDARAGNTATMLPAVTIVRRQLGYHAARLASYAMLGAVFGGAGAASMDAVAWAPLQRTLYLVANASLLLLGLGMLVRIRPLAWLQLSGARAFALILPVTGSLLQLRGTPGRIALGLVWGLMPCAMVYGVLPLALFSGGAWQGAAVMAAFGVGTLPNVVAAGVLLGRARHRFDGLALRCFAAVLLVAFALVGAYRALWVADALTQGPFCLG